MIRPFAAARLATTSGSRKSPRSAFSIELVIRAARRASSSSRSNSRDTAMVSSARPSVVVKICASTMLAPATAQAPARIESSQGWSGASTVSSVTPRAAGNETVVASDLPASLGGAHEAGMGDLLRQIDLEPIGRIVQADIGVDLLPASNP